jgi:hypothetical protein
VLKAEKRDAWLNLIIQVEPDEPYRIASLGLAPGSRPDNYEEIENDKESPKEGGSEDGAMVELDAKFSNLEELERYLHEKEKKNEFFRYCFNCQGWQSHFSKSIRVCVKKIQSSEQA